MSEPAPGAQSTHRPQPSGTAELKGSAPGADTRQRRSQGRAAMPRTGGTGTRDAGSARGPSARAQPAHDIFTRQSMLQPPHVEWSLTHLCDSSVSGTGNLSLCHLSCLRRVAHRAARVHDLQDWILGGRVRLNEGRPCVDRNRAFRYARLRHKAISALGPQPH